MLSLSVRVSSCVLLRLVHSHLRCSPAVVVPSSPVCLFRTFLAVPLQCRVQVWFEMSGAAARASCFPEGTYRLLSHSGASSQALYEIAKDVDRTFPGHSFFDSADTMAALQVCSSPPSPCISPPFYCFPTRVGNPAKTPTENFSGCFWAVSCVRGSLSMPFKGTICWGFVVVNWWLPAPTVRHCCS